MFPRSIKTYESKKLGSVSSVNIETLKDVVLENEGLVTMIQFPESAYGTTVTYWSVTLIAALGNMNNIAWIEHEFNRAIQRRVESHRVLSKHVLNTQASHPFETNEPQGDMLVSWHPLDCAKLIEDLKAQKAIEKDQEKPYRHSGWMGLRAAMLGDKYLSGD